jgi:hypothetical protein
MLKTLLIYFGEMLIGILIINYSIKLFLVYLLFILIFRFEAIRKLTRLYNVSTEIKILAIAKKIGMAEKEIEQVADEQFKKLSDKQRRSLERDLKNI